VTPAERHVWGGYYEDGSLIWRSRWTTTSGIIECREALAFPGDPHRAVILRRIIAVQGDARVQVLLEPSAGFGRAQLRELRCDEGGAWHGRIGDLTLRWTSATPAQVDSLSRRLSTTLTVPNGDHHNLVLELSETPHPDPAPDPDWAWQATETAWREAMPRLGNTIAPHDARHAYAVLRGLTSAGGGMAAAATTSLPDAWSTLADTIIADAAADCLHPTGRWQRAPDDPRIDARTTPVPPRSPTPRASRKSATATEDVRHNCCDGLPPEAKGLGATVVGLRVVP
jgi:hypothetical protein